MDNTDTPYYDDTESEEPKIELHNKFAARLVKLSHHRAQGPSYYKVKGRSRSLNKYIKSKFNYLGALEDTYSYNVLTST